MREPAVAGGGSFVAMALAFTLLVSSCGDSGSGNAPVGGVVGEAERCFVTVRFTGDGELTNGDVFLEYTGVEGGFGAPGPTTRCRAPGRGGK